MRLKIQNKECGYELIAYYGPKSWIFEFFFVYYWYMIYLYRRRGDGKLQRNIEVEKFPDKYRISLHGFRYGWSFIPFTSLFSGG